jgi:hypothetical protein
VFVQNVACRQHVCWTVPSSRLAHWLAAASKYARRRFRYSDREAIISASRFGAASCRYPLDGIHLEDRDGRRTNQFVEGMTLVQVSMRLKGQ